MLTEMNDSPIRELGGLGTLLSSVVLNIYNIIYEGGIDTLYLTLTSIGGLLYLMYKIKTQRSKAIEADITTRIKQIELDVLEKKQRNEQ